MNKKPTTAAALAGILQARRGDETKSETVIPEVSEAPAVSDPSPSPAPLPEPAREVLMPLATAKRQRGGKSSDKANYSQFSVYLRKDTRRKVGRALEDRESEHDFSELVQTLLEQWLKSGT